MGPHSRVNTHRLRILHIIGAIEEKAQKCFHEIDVELENKCIDALDEKMPASYVINSLTRLYDELEEME